MDDEAIIGFAITVAIFSIFLFVAIITSITSDDKDPIQGKIHQPIQNNLNSKSKPIYISEFEEDYEEKDEEEEDMTPKKKFCTSCGEELPGNPKFCPNCGSKNISYSETESENSSSNVVVSVHQTNSSESDKTPVRCPKCGSTNIHFITSQGGQRIDKGDACCGFLACGPIGLLCGVKDQETKTVRKCMNCNNEF